MARLLLLLLPLLVLPLAPAWAVVPPGDPGGWCRAAIAAAERGFGIPTGLMAAIGVVESGRRGAGGRVDPWPWSIDAEGTGRVFDSKAAAIQAVRALQAAGVRSIDVGCMQVNLLQHPDAFPDLDTAFAPEANATFAARFLRQLYTTAGSWPQAAALYHSATPALAADYRRKVMAAWPVELARGGGGVWPANAGLPIPAVGGLTAGGMPPAHMLLRAVPAPRALRAVPAPRALPPANRPGGLTGRRLATYRAAPVPLALH